MFYTGKMTSIRSSDKVLEIGPGATPHPRSNAFLELKFESDDVKIAQRGGGIADGAFGSRSIFYYDGNAFPFQDNSFDYVICSHVVEHVENPEFFMREIFRVGGGRGYIEYPMITYEYMYSFDVHKNFLKFDFDNNILIYLKKTEYQFREFASVQLLFNKMLEIGWDDLCAPNKEVFFEGFEFQHPFEVSVAKSISQLCPPSSVLVRKPALRRLILRVMNRLKI
jgi:SAM-dependent methyltransferase